MTSIPVAICRSFDNNLIFDADLLTTRLSQKGKTFGGFFIAFLKCAWNLEHSEKEEEYSSLIITEIIASERDVYLSV